MLFCGLCNIGNDEEILRRMLNGNICCEISLFVDSNDVAFLLEQMSVSPVGRKGDMAEILPLPPKKSTFRPTVFSFTSFCKFFCALNFVRFSRFVYILCISRDQVGVQKREFVELDILVIPNTEWPLVCVKRIS